MPKLRIARSLMSRPFWWPTIAIVRPPKRADPRHDGVIVRPAAVAVQLDPVVEDPLDVVERVRPVLVPGELDLRPDLLVGRLRLDPVELALEPLELAREARAAQEIESA